METKKFDFYFKLANELYSKHFARKIITKETDTDYEKPDCILLLVELLQLEDAENV